MLYLLETSDTQRLVAVDLGHDAGVVDRSRLPDHWASYLMPNVLTAADLQRAARSAQHEGLQLTRPTCCYAVPALRPDRRPSAAWAEYE